MADIYVYHSSDISGLKILEPRISTHKKPWVYATKNIASSAMFLGKNSDLICQTGIIDSKPYIWERFTGALQVAYQGRKGSIYLLEPGTFKSGQTSWSEELVSDHPVTVKKEMIVDDVFEFLKQLKDKRELNIYCYPDAPPGFPSGKQDLIEKAIKWTIEFGEDTLNDIEKYHPDITGEIIERLRSQSYIFKSPKWLNWI